MRNKPIAILSSDRNATMIWLKTTFDAMPMDSANSRMWMDKKGQQYWIVEDAMHTKGVEFSEYFKAPNYISLEDIVKTRVRK